MSRPSVEYKIFPDYTVTSPCIYRLSYKGKFVFVKAKDQAQSVKTVQKLLRQFLDGSDSARKLDNLYHHFFTFIEKNPGAQIKLRTIYTDDNCYNLLLREQLLLDAHRREPNCLNNQVEAYIPLYNEDTQQYGWIDKGSVLSFKKWLKAHRKVRKTL